MERGTAPLKIEDSLAQSAYSVRAWNLQHVAQRYKWQLCPEYPIPEPRRKSTQHTESIWPQTFDVVPDSIATLGSAHTARGLLHATTSDPAKPRIAGQSCHTSRPLITFERRSCYEA
ncbi:hypothetical protein J1614_001550 [Plenodomus biglobosus]|nr:hypothetical protein J1614_001550 [Plenodomus biglobosus]